MDNGECYQSSPQPVDIILINIWQVLVDLSVAQNEINTSFLKVLFPYFQVSTLNLNFILINICYEDKIRGKWKV